MMTKQEERVSKYKFAMDVKRVVREAARLRKMAANYSRAAEVQAFIETGVKGLLAAEPVSSVMVIWYMTYAKSIGRLQRQCRDLGKLKIVVGPLTAKWQQRGLDERIMRRIRTELFDLREW